MATTEVAQALEALGFLQEVNVYGATVPGAQPASLRWEREAPGWRASAAQPCPNTPQGTKAGPGWQPWFCVPPTLCTLSSSTPTLLSTCRLTPGLGS